MRKEVYKEIERVLKNYDTKYVDILLKELELYEKMPGIIKTGTFAGALIYVVMKKEKPITYDGVKAFLWFRGLNVEKSEIQRYVLKISRWKRDIDEN